MIMGSPVSGPRSWETGLDPFPLLGPGTQEHCLQSVISCIFWSELYELHLIYDYVLCMKHVPIIGKLRGPGTSEKPKILELTAPRKNSSVSYLPINNVYNSSTLIEY